MGTRETYRNTLAQACLALGDENALAKKLGLSMEQLLPYLMGTSRIPDDLFLKAVDIVLESHGKRVEKNGQWLDDYLKRAARK